MAKTLDDKIKTIAETDWQKFMEFVGPDVVLIIKTRVLRGEGKSWQQISIQLGISPQSARTLMKVKNKAVKNGQA